MFIVYKGIAVDVKENRDGTLSAQLLDAKMQANNIEEMEKLIRFEIEKLVQDYYEDIIPLEAEHPTLSKARKEAYDNLKNIGDSLSHMSVIFQNPLFCLDEECIQCWEDSYKDLINEIEASLVNSIKCIRNQGWPRND
jgi:regulator of replication initiation timing